MYRNQRTILMVGFLLYTAAVSAQTAQLNACDLNADGVVSKADVDLAVTMSLGPASACTANVMGAGVCNVLVVQRVINAVTGTCVTGNPHSVTLDWVASTSTGVVGYIVHRGTVPGGPYTPLFTTAVAGVTYTDTSVQAGQTYYYVVTAIDGSNTASIYSNEAPAVVPYP
ncbi:hypothetical protein [Paludibaculum fermentans]|uniref:hypothetical protein n=1 Tax=Paludibaculum fermentans TaxID=1473598 RepID=UPI003EBDB3C0